MSGKWDSDCRALSPSKASICLLHTSLSASVITGVAATIPKNPLTPPPQLPVNCLNTQRQFRKLLFFRFFIKSQANDAYQLKTFKTFKHSADVCLPLPTFLMLEVKINPLLTSAQLHI